MASQEKEKAPRKIAKAFREKSRKRRRNLFKKANELAHLTSSDLYVVVHQRGRFYTYTSSEQPGWPPPDCSIVSNVTPVVAD